MDRETYNAFRRKAIRYASSKGFAHIAEDFAHEYILHVLETRSQFIDTFFVDFLRVEYKGSRKPENRNRIFYNYDDLDVMNDDNKLSSELITKYAQRCEEYNEKQTEKTKLLEFSPLVKEILKAFAHGRLMNQIMKKFEIDRSFANQIRAIHLMGEHHTQRKVAEVMRITESRVSQILTEFKRSQQQP